MEKEICEYLREDSRHKAAEEKESGFGWASGWETAINQGHRRRKSGKIRGQIELISPGPTKTHGFMNSGRAVAKRVDPHKGSPFRSENLTGNRWGIKGHHYGRGISNEHDQAKGRVGWA